MSSEELKPCPFCGGDVSFHKDEDCPGCHLIQCGQCRAFFDFATGADPGNDCESVDALRAAIAPMWNRRAERAAAPATSAAQRAVPDGYALVPVEPTPDMAAQTAYNGTHYSDPFDFEDFKKDYAAMLAAAPAPVVPEVPALWAKSLGFCWAADADYPEEDWIVGTVDEDGNRYDVLRVEASQYDAAGESQKIAEAIVALWAWAAHPAERQEQGEVQRLRLVEMIDAAMVEMQNISPPLRRSECERLIRAALAASTGQERGEVQRLREALERATKLLSAAAGYATKMEPMPAKLLNAIDAELDASTGQEVEK